MWKIMVILETLQIVLEIVDIGHTWDIGDD